MMKKIVSMAMAAVMAATFMVAAPTVDVKAATTEINKETVVSYNNSTDFSNATYTVTIPAYITFANGSKVATTSVTLGAADGSEDLTTALPTDLEVKISVTSENIYTLLNAEDTATPKKEALEYTLDYDNAGIDDATEPPVSLSTAVTEDANEAGVEIGTLKPAAAEITGKAVLTSLIVPTFDGDYTDNLTFKISDNLETAEP